MLSNFALLFCLSEMPPNFVDTVKSVQELALFQVGIVLLCLEKEDALFSLPCCAAQSEGTICPSLQSPLRTSAAVSWPHPDYFLELICAGFPARWMLKTVFPHTTDNTLNTAAALNCCKVGSLPPFLFCCVDGSCWNMFWPAVFLCSGHKYIWRLTHTHWFFPPLCLKS